jgi:hypothetical protein
LAWVTDPKFLIQLAIGHVIVHVTEGTGEKGEKHPPAARTAFPAIATMNNYAVVCINPPYSGKVA